MRKTLEYQGFMERETANAMWSEDESAIMTGLVYYHTRFRKRVVVPRNRKAFSGTF